MQLDKQKLALLLALPDDALKEILSDLAKEAGVSPASLGLDLEKLDAVRAALANASDEDLAAIKRLMEEQNNRGQR